MKHFLKTIGVFTLVLVTAAFTTPETDGGGYGIGDVVKDFSLKNIDGKMVSLSDFNEAKGYIVTFTCNTCPYAVAYEQRIIDLDKKFAPKGYPVIAIMPNNTTIKPGDGFEAMQRRAKDKGYTFPYLIDEDQSVFPQFGATKTPHIFVLDSDGNRLDGDISYRESKDQLLPMLEKYAMK